MKFLKLFVAAPILISISAANAAIIDFVNMTESSSGLGESAWTTLSIVDSEFTLDITGIKDGQAATAYLDWGHAGLGVCGLAGTTNLNTARPGNRGNICWQGSDDNVTTNESLSFMFDTNVVVDKIWFNNTHDPDRYFVAPDLVTIDGTDYLGVGNGYAPTTSYSGYNSSVDNWLGSFSVNANSAFTIAYNNEQFYVSGMEVHAVPEPSVIALFAAGLLGLGFAARRRQS